MIYTFSKRVGLTNPPNITGRTALVDKFLTDDSGYLYCQNACWNDAPHLTPEIQKEMLASIPEWQHDMRSKGIPVMGSGMVFPMDESTFKIDPITIPAHWPRICAMDIGISHDTTAAWSAYDSETDTIYVYDCYNAAGGTPADHAPVIKGRGQWIPCVLPHDAQSMEKGSGMKIIDYYLEEGVNAQPEPFYNPPSYDGKHNNHVEPGIMEMIRRMKDGRLKVFSTCERFFEEFRRYHRKDGKIVKVFDDQTDSVRYSVMSVTHRGLSEAEYEMSKEPYYDSEYEVRY